MVAAVGGGTAVEQAGMTADAAGIAVAVAA